ncbi:hypothetical protein [Streptomyces microflavus]|uniref:Uncharacterized protein n=1 Tax=Streptomyces microflavus TaxID=1919 RepID=A0ABV1QBH7_STRMI
MGSGNRSALERVEHLRGLLGGARATTRAARTLAGFEHGNVLIGAALHGADRARRGLEPTDLEERLLGVLGTVLTPQEIESWGRVYRESVDKLGDGVAVVPRSVASLAVESGYSAADLVAGFGPVVEEALAKPNVAVVDREVLAAGGPVDSPEFLEGMREFGYGVTAFSGAQGPSPDAGRAAVRQELPPVHARLELESFVVERAVGDQGGGRDEIYWCASSGSNKTSGAAFTSQEFGAATEGTEFTFSTSNRTVFDGSTSSGVALGLYVWEADQSNSEWYDALNKSLNDLCRYIFDTPQWELGTGLMPGSDVVAFMGEAIKLGSWLMEHLRNHDDLSCSRGIVLDQYDLAVIAQRGTTKWAFNGDGYHTLTLRYTGDPVPFPAGTLEYVVRDGTSWGTPVTMPAEFSAATTPALAHYGGTVHAVFVRPSDNALMWTYKFGPLWMTPAPIQSDVSTCAPALASYNGNLVCAHAGSNTGHLYVREFLPDQGWSTVLKEFKGDSTRLSPALTAHGDMLLLTHVGNNGFVYHREHHIGRGWGETYEDDQGWETESPVTTASAGGELWKVVRRRQNNVRTYMMIGDNHGTGIIPGWETENGLAAVGHENRIWLFRRRLDGLLAGAPTGAWTDINPTTSVPILDEPAAVSNGAGRLYVMYRR